MELATPGSAVRFTSVARHVTDCATQPSIFLPCPINSLNVYKHLKCTKNKTCANRHWFLYFVNFKDFDNKIELHMNVKYSILKYV